MSTTLWLVMLAAALALGIVAGWFLLEKRRRTHLRQRFGPEYDREVHRSGTTRTAEKELERRERRVEQLEIRPLPAEERSRFLESWRSVQAAFVDEPERAVARADELVEEVMERRGYPIGDFEQRSADISVDHPLVISNYRAAHAIASESHRGPVATEDLRQAMVHYRALFEDLLEARSTDGEKEREVRHARHEIA